MDKQESLVSAQSIETIESIELIEPISLDTLDILDLGDEPLALEDIAASETFEVAEDKPSADVDAQSRSKKRKGKPAAPSLETLLAKAEENQLALETRMAIEYKTIDERMDYRFNKMEAFQRELIAETRRSSRDVRLLAGISIVASIAVIIISLVR